MIKSLIAPLAFASLAFAVPQAASAQEYPVKNAEYVEVTGISIDDGHAMDYANHLAGIWRKGQDFAVSQGWIEGYEILQNVHPREGEPDIYLLTRFTSFPTAAEEEARDKAYVSHMAMTNAQMQKASEGRADYRSVDGTMMLRRLVWRD